LNEYKYILANEQRTNTKLLSEILKKYDVQDWKDDYTTENPDTYEDGYGWQLWLQYEDGTVEKHGGTGTTVEKVTPENFQDFKTELSTFMDEKISS